MVDLEYFAILRRYQLENLHSYDEDERPTKVSLINYRSHTSPDTDYYNPEDLFIPLGEWLRDKNVARRRASTAKNKKTLHPPPSPLM